MCLCDSQWMSDLTQLHKHPLLLSSRPMMSTTDTFRVLVVDDDADLRTLLLGYLTSHRMHVDAVADGASLRAWLVRNQADLLLLDLMLPDDDGLNLCLWAKRTYPAMSVIMLTAQGDPTSRVLGLEIGADDYLPKPFEPRELVARIKAVLRRGGAAAQPSTSVIRFAGRVFDRLRHEVVVTDGTMVALSAAEYRLLSAFVDHPGRVLSRDQLLDMTRAPGVVVNDRSIDLTVSRLRAKLGDDGHKERPLIRTARGAGYLFDTGAKP
ncbi:MAG: two-component system OmpR family response regulator [Comamonadaceae bacterium]|nr:MAG: two-component system OmpR family response regulator [Comamonadaceae bacterium]